MMNFSLRKLVVGTLFLVSLSGTAIAGGWGGSGKPTQCRYGSGKAAYDRAYNDRFNELERAWNFQYRANCDKQVQFEQIYNTHFSESGPTSRRCRNAGWNRATQDLLADVSYQCYTDGKKDGRQDGHKLAREYCGYTHGIWGDYQPAYGEACRRVFIEFVERHCPEKVRNWSRFYSEVKTKCAL